MDYSTHEDQPDCAQECIRDYSRGGTSRNRCVLNRSVGLSQKEHPIGHKNLRHDFLGSGDGLSDACGCPSLVSRAGSKKRPRGRAPLLSRVR